MTARRPSVCAAAVLALASPALAQVPDWPSERPPRPLAAREVKFPPYAFKTLANGLQVIAVSHHEQPAVTLRLLVRAGAAQDPPSKPGTAALAASLLDQGTTTRSAEQIATSIDSIGGVLGTGAGSDLTFINTAVMRDSLDVAMQLLAEVARNPAFSPQEVERQRQQIMSAMKVSYEDPDYIAGTVFDRLVYGFHPYGKPDSGTPASVTSLTREDLVAFHARWFGANNAILAIVGDVTHDRAFAAAEKVFGNWAKVDVPIAAAAQVPPATRRVIVVDRPGAVQTEIRVGHIGLPRRHKDFLALDLALKILGGEGGNRLHRVLRTERGLTYGAEADMHALKDTGDIVVKTDTRSETTAEAVRLIVDEIWRLQKQRVQPRELADAQAYLTGSFPLTIETPGAIALQVLNAVFYGLDLEELQNYRERVNAITAEDIQRVAQQYLHPDRLSIVLVGDGSIFAKDLSAAGFDQVERIPLASLDLDAPDLRRKSVTPARRLMPASWRPSFPAPSAEGRPSRAADEETSGSFDQGTLGPSDPASRELIDRAVRAKGGLALLRGIKTVKSTSLTTFATPQGARRVSATTYVRYPAQFRMDARGPEGLIIQTFDNGTVWVADDSGARDAPPQFAGILKAGVQRDIISMLLALNDNRVRNRRVADVVVEGKPVPSLEVELAPARRVTLLFDPETFLLVAQRYGGGPGDPATEETFSDYRDVQGMKVAFRIRVRIEGQPPIERLTQTIDFNVPVDPTLFVKPASSNSSVQPSAFSVQRSAFSLQRSAFSVQRFECG
jgi:zinc protease